MCEFYDITMADRTSKVDTDLSNHVLASYLEQKTSITIMLFCDDWHKKYQSIRKGGKDLVLLFSLSMCLYWIAEFVLLYLC